MNEELSKILHQPIRTRIMTFLFINRAVTYTQLKKEFNLSDGHMTTHMRELLNSEYVELEKKFIDNKPNTTYVITKTGDLEFTAYISQLKDIIKKMG